MNNSISSGRRYQILHIVISILVSLEADSLQYLAHGNSGPRTVARIIAQLPCQ